jgi:hypothetical protein
MPTQPPTTVMPHNDPPTSPRRISRNFWGYRIVCLLNHAYGNLRREQCKRQARSVTRKAQDLQRQLMSWRDHEYPPGSPVDVPESAYCDGLIEAAKATVEELAGFDHRHGADYDEVKTIYERLLAKVKSAIIQILEKQEPPRGASEEYAGRGDD